MLHDQLNHITVIIIFGALILLAFIKITNPLKINKKGNRWFALFLMLYASFWLEEIAEFMGVDVLNSLFASIVHSVQILTSIVFYFSVLFYAIPGFKYKRKHVIHLVIPLTYVAINSLKYINQQESELVHTVRVIIILSLSVVYLLLAYLEIRKHQKNIFLYSSNTQGRNLVWLEYILLQMAVVLIAVLIHNLFVSTQDINLLINFIQIITVFVIAYFALSQKEIFPEKEEAKNQLSFVTDEVVVDNEKKKLISDDNLPNLKQKLVHLMDGEKPYLDSELNLVRLAEMLRITPHQLSYAINTGFDENFFQFINRYRVERAKEILCANSNETMLAVAFDSGFNSKTAFNTTFKKITQQTPSEFKKTCSNL